MIKKRSDLGGTAVGRPWTAVPPGQSDHRPPMSESALTLDVKDQRSMP